MKLPRRFVDSSSQGCARPGEARGQQPGGRAAAGEGGGGVRVCIPLRGCESGGQGGEHPQV